jgi:hypothetical protein
MMDVQRRDGRTATSCEEITVVKGRMIKETVSQLTIESISQRIVVEKGSFKYDEMDNRERYYVIARKGKTFKLVDYV